MPKKTRLLSGIGVALFFCYAQLAFMSQSRWAFDLGLFFLLMALAFGFYALAYHFARNLTDMPMVWVWCPAILFRVLGLVGEPLFEDDYFRYLWDGYRFAVDGTPYGKAPEAFFTDPAVDKPFRTLLGQINNPEIPTIYGPTFQYLFLLAFHIAAGQLWPLKLALIAIDLWLIRNLFLLASPQRVLLYAWNPLVIKEIAFTAHPDGVMVSLLMACWLLRQRQQSLVAGLLLALAATCKASAWLLVPFLLLGLGWLGTFAFAFGLVTLYAPFWWQGATDAAGLAAFANRFEFNSALYGLVRLWLPDVIAKALLAGALLSVTGIYLHHYWRTGHRPLPRGDYLLGGLLLVSPVINPWYLLWLLPFACVYRNATAWVASLALLLSYATELNLGDGQLPAYNHPLWLRPLEYAFIGIAGWHEYRHKTAKWLKKANFSS